MRTAIEEGRMEAFAKEFEKRPKLPP
jgi:hypothetical protein